jgi:pimeloyl-ACP methyl ester carboxylesterase
MEPLTIFIGGTMAVPLYCRPSANDCGHAVVRTIPGWGLRSLDESQGEIAAWIDLRTDPDQPLILVGHSEGALHAALYGLDRPNVLRVISVSGPHHGTIAAAFLARVFPAMRDMSPRSDFMQRYEARLPEIAPRMDCFGFDHDPLIVPSNSAYVEGAKNHRCGALTDHLSQLLVGRVRRTLRDIHGEALNSAA